jgi:hypothetical protein
VQISLTSKGARDGGALLDIESNAEVDPHSATAFSRNAFGNGETR